jgi:hypothetical protein
MADCQRTALETSVQSLEASIPSTDTARRRVCALYMRVSTRNHGQTTDTQAVALAEYAETAGIPRCGVPRRSRQRREGPQACTR